MNIFEPLFLLVVLATVVTLLTAAVFALTGQGGRAGRLLARLILALGAYFAVVIVASLRTPRRQYRVGDAQCFDDWCITVVSAARGNEAHRTRYIVTLRLTNRARRVPMGEKGTVVYLIDSNGRRYDPEPDATAMSFDTILQPGTSILTTRQFDVAADAQELGLIYTHEGGFPIGWFIATEGGWFQKPPIVWLE